MADINLNKKEAIALVLKADINLAATTNLVRREAIVRVIITMKKVVISPVLTINLVLIKVVTTIGVVINLVADIIRVVITIVADISNAADIIREVIVSVRPTMTRMPNTA